MRYGRHSVNGPRINIRLKYVRENFPRSAAGTVIDDQMIRRELALIARLPLTARPSTRPSVRPPNRSPARTLALTARIHRPFAAGPPSSPVRFLSPARWPARSYVRPPARPFARQPRP